MVSVVHRFFTDALELFLEFFQILVGKVFKIDKFVSRAFECADDFVQLQLKCFGIAVLRVLNEEHHQERDDGRAGVDNELPGIGEMKSWPGKAQMMMMRMAAVKTQALPRMMDDWRAKTRKASRTTQKKSRDAWCSLSFSACVSFITPF